MLPSSGSMAAGLQRINRSAQPLTPARNAPYGPVTVNVAPALRPKTSGAYIW